MEYQFDEIRLKRKYLLKSETGEIIWRDDYNLGTGHLRRLSHYIRHLFQIVKFVDDQPPTLIDDNKKYDYITNLRAQLSTFEQYLIYYNALSVLGTPWMTPAANNTEGYLSKYCIIKSLPIYSADFYKRPDHVLPKKNSLGKPMFEWTEVQNRLKALANKQ